MDGIILFADDSIFNTDTFEEKLFKSFQAEKKFPVVGVNTIELLEKACKSISTYRALILDWNFKPDQEVEEGLEIPDENPDSFLLENNIFSLIYIYSENLIEGTEKGDDLKTKYGNKIKFKRKDKGNPENYSKEKEQILKEIAEFEASNSRLKVPFIWSQSINQSVQKIFKELEQADENWINELYKTARIDGVDPSVEVINLFQNILSENIIQEESLKKLIKEVAESGAELTDPEHYAKLIRILYFGKPATTDPIMTGDIFKGAEHDQFFIVITPECDLRHVRSYEVLQFSKGDYKANRSKFELKAKNIKAGPLIARAEEFKKSPFTNKERELISQELNKQLTQANRLLKIEAFTQTNNPRFHLLPCFEFEAGDFSGIGLIDFRFALSVISGTSLSIENRISKLNTPYIQELRQRYLAYKGRVGVPGNSSALREWLLAGK